MMKTVLFSPGYPHDIKSMNYRKVLKAMEEKGYKALFVPIVWKRKTLMDYETQLMSVFEEHDPKKTILAGFSFGATTSFMVAAERNPSELWLFSLSPYFKEQYKHLKKSWLTGLGHRRDDEIKKLSFDKMAAKIHCKTILIIGSEEADKWSTMKMTTDRAKDKIANIKLITASGVGHEIDHPNYIEAIRNNI